MRRISEYRPVIVLVVLVALSVVSLAAGAQGNAVARGVQSVVGAASYPFLRAMTSAEDGLAYLRGLLFQYNDALENADRLELQLAARLQQDAHYAELSAENVRLAAFADFQQARPELELLPCRVIQHAQGILTIDRGTRDGIRPSMCVVTPDGVVGMVTDAGRVSASVVTLQNPDCRIDVMLARNRVRGRVHGTGNDLSAVCRMFYVDINANVRDGDRVVTSPDSVFPSGYPVGAVTGTPYRGPLSQSAEIHPAVDPFRLDEVFVLLGAAPNAAALAGPTEIVVVEDPNPTHLTDTRTIQERYAP